MTGGPYVILLTGGYTPAVQGDCESDVQFGQRQHTAPDGPPTTVLDICRERYAAFAAEGDAGRETGLAVAVDEAWRAGWHQAAMLYRVVALWTAPDEQSAQRLAALITREIDPAHVRKAGDALSAALDACEHIAIREEPEP